MRAREIWILIYEDTPTDNDLPISTDKMGANLGEVLFKNRQKVLFDFLN